MSQSIQHFESAQKKTIALLRELVDQIENGQSEATLRNLAISLAKDAGFTGWVRPPLIQIHSEEYDRKIHPGAFIRIHLQPATKDAFGSSGLSKFHEAPTSQNIEIARELCSATSIFSNSRKCLRILPG